MIWSLHVTTNLLMASERSGRRLNMLPINQHIFSTVPAISHLAIKCIYLFMFANLSVMNSTFHHVQASRAAAYVLDTNVHFDKRKYTNGNSAGARTLISTFSCRSTCTLVFFFFF